MSETTRDLESLTAEAVEHLQRIRKYTGWMAFFVVLAGVWALLGVVVFFLNAVTTTSASVVP